MIFLNKTHFFRCFQKQKLLHSSTLFEVISMKNWFGFATTEVEI